MRGPFLPHEHCYSISAILWSAIVTRARDYAELTKNGISWDLKSRLQDCFELGTCSLFRSVSDLGIRISNFLLVLMGFRIRNSRCYLKASLYVLLLALLLGVGISAAAHGQASAPTNPNFSTHLDNCQFYGVKAFQVRVNSSGESLKVVVV